MAYSRYTNRLKIRNENELYSDLLEKKDIPFINQYVSPENIINLSRDFAFEEYEWKSQDRLYKLAQRYYGDSKLWWVIAHINQKPTDSHFQPGDLVKIPTRETLDEVLRYLGY